MSVRGPFARYWRTTISVAAGAVAAAIEPKTIANGTFSPDMISTKSTNNTAPKASVSPIISGAFPIFLRKESLNSAPIEKAINPSAISGINSAF